MTPFYELTEMWQDHQYNQIGIVITRENWSNTRLVEFCAYFCKYLGTDQLNILHKFI